jgi:mannose-6-phosphate isomerase-like protein (cupin superfamily)
MIVRSHDAMPEIVGPSRHGGEGEITQRRMFEDHDLVSNLFIVAVDVLPPGASIGVHPHPTEEEIYFILEGRGIMTVDDEEREVSAGDMVLTRPGSSHGLRNHSEAPLRMLALGVDTEEGTVADDR